MAYFDEKTGELLLTDEDREGLREGLGKNWAKNIINKIIYNEEITNNK